LSLLTAMCNRVIDVIAISHYRPHTHARMRMKALMQNVDYIDYIDYTPPQPWVTIAKMEIQ
jgi:hypothetical protein